MPAIAFRAEKARTSAGALAGLGLVLLFGVILTPLASAGVRVVEALGGVQHRSPGGGWERSTAELKLPGGTEIRTGKGSRCIIEFEDRSRVEIGPNSIFMLEDSEPAKASMKFNLGIMKAWVTKAMSRHFTVRTPTAVCSVRGTEFGVAVREGGATDVDLYKGLLAVGDNKGNETLLKDNQSVRVDAGGLGPVKGGEEGKAGEGDKARQALKREVGLEMTKEEVQAAAALEQKAAVYKEGKALIDVNGHRVRLEDYVIRSAANQFKLVVLNERTDRFDYFYYLGTFNRPLPDDLSVALRQIQGQAFTAPEYFLTAYETGRSNTQDYVKETATGGHLVNVNSNGDTADDVTSFFNPGTDRVVSLTASDPFFKTVFDNYNLVFNGVSHHSWAPNVAAYAPTLDGSGYAVYSAGNITGAQNDSQVTETHVTSLVSPPNCTTTDACTISPEPGKFHDSIYLENATGTIWEKFENYIINDEGKVASYTDFAGATSGTIFKSLLANWNYQQIITASEFGGRKIDLVFEPKVLMQSGLIPCGEKA